MSKSFELTRRRLLAGAVVVGGGSAAAGAGTFAYFSDSESSSGNEITAGTLELGSSTDAQISVSDIAPGDSIPSSGTNSISTTYDSNSTIDPIEADLSTSVGEPGSEPTEPSNSSDQSAASFAGQLNVDTADAVRGGTSQRDLTTSPQSVSTVADLNGLSVDDAFGDVSPGDTIQLDLAVTFDSGSGNDFQADGVIITVTFSAQQPSAD